MSRQRLTCGFVRAVARPGRYGDGGRGSFGLSLLVKPARSGGLIKNWQQRYGKDGKYTSRGLGVYPDVSLEQLPTTRGIWSTALTTDRQGRRRHVGHRIETWARQMKHADGITWFLSKLEAEARDDPDSELLWSVPTARSDRAYNWGR